VRRCYTAKTSAARHTQARTQARTAPRQTRTLVRKQLPESRQKARANLETDFGSGISHVSTAFQSGNTTDGHHGSLPPRPVGSAARTHTSILHRAEARGGARPAAARSHAGARRYHGLRAQCSISGLLHRAPPPRTRARSVPPREGTMSSFGTRCKQAGSGALAPCATSRSTLRAAAATHPLILAQHSEPSVRSAALGAAAILPALRLSLHPLLTPGGPTSTLFRGKLWYKILLHTNNFTQAESTCM
jgi:hypothetical protein